MKKKRSDILKNLLQETKKGLVLTALAVAGVLAAGTQKTWAMEMPTEEQIQEYKKDGSLQERIDYYNDLTENYSQGLIADKLKEENANSRSHYPESFGSEGRMPTEGEAGIILVRVDFQDMTFGESDTEDALRKIAFGEADETDPHYPYESLAAYYNRASYGKLQISGDVYSYTAKHERAYYGESEERINELYEETMDALDERGVDFSQYDKNGDGYLDGVYLHFAGENTGWGSIWWSATYMNSLEEKEYDGKKIGYHAKLSEPSDEEETSRTLIHETGHMLGVPDYYSYTAQTFENGIKTYDMMYDNMGDFNAFSKWLLGWIEDDEILQLSLDDKDKVEQEAELSSLSSWSSEKNTYKAAVVSMQDKGIFSEYYLVEYDTEQENQTGLRFNSEKLPEGFRVFHVNAELNEAQTGFKYMNSVAGQTKLIELTDPDISDTHRGEFPEQGELKWFGEVPGTNLSEQYHCFYLEGDSLTPDTYPSTELSDSHYYGKSGISLTEFQPQGEKGSLKITVEPVNPPDPSDLEITVAYAWSQILQSNVISVPIELSKQAKLNTEPDAPYLLLKDGTRAEGELYSYSGKMYQLYVSTDELEAGTYEMILPAGTFQLGDDSYSLEERVEVTVGTNAKIQKDISLNKGVLYACGSSADGGWCMASTSEEAQDQLQFVRIGKEGEISEKTIDISNWEDWCSDGWSYYSYLLQLPDGSWVLTEDDYQYERTLAVHFDQEGNLLGEIQQIQGTRLKMYVVGNTVKAVLGNGSNSVARMWNLDFNGQPQEVPIESEENYYYFYDHGYAVGHLDGTPVGYSQVENANLQEGSMKMDYELMDENDQKIAEYQFEFGDQDTALQTINQIAALEKDGKFYLIGAEISPYIWKTSFCYYENMTLYLYQIDEMSGQITKKTKISEPVRFILGSGEYGTPEKISASWAEDKIMLCIMSENSVEGSLSDLYLLNWDGTIDKRISNLTGETPIVSGNRALLNTQSGAESKYKIYSFADSADPSDPDKPVDPDKPDDPVTPDDPSEPTKPSDPKKDPTGKNQEKTKTTAADKAGGSGKAKASKTGDQNPIPLAAAGMVAGAGLAAGVLAYRKKKVTGHR